MTPSRYHDAARIELERAAEHDEDQRAGRGIALSRAVLAAIQAVELLPRSAPTWRPAIEGHEVRRIKVDGHPYLVIYTVRRDELFIVAIAHTSRAPGYWRERIN